jgi:hypothetical protein
LKKIRCNITPFLFVGFLLGEQVQPSFVLTAYLRPEDKEEKRNHEMRHGFRMELVGMSEDIYLPMTHTLVDGKKYASTCLYLLSFF